MLEYYTYRKFKAHRERQLAEAAAASAGHAVGQTPSADVVISQGTSSASTAVEKGKVPQSAADAIDEQDERFLEKSLASTSATEEPATLMSRIANAASQLPVLRRVGRHSGASQSDGTPSRAGISGQRRPEDVEDADTLESDPLADEETQRTQLQRLLEAFNMNLAPETAGPSSSISQRMTERFKVSTFNDKTRLLMAEFMQILKDIQSGVPLAGRDLQDFFEKHTADLKTANDSVPSFIKALVLKLLPFSAVPSIEELSKPGALMGLIKSVLQVLRQRFPAFVGGSVLMVMAVVVVMLGVWYTYKRGREERETSDNPSSSFVSEVGNQGIGQGREVEISVDGVRYVTIVDEDGMRIPVPQDERGVYWDKTK